jgi:hypothetical protein
MNYKVFIDFEIDPNTDQKKIDLLCRSVHYAARVLQLQYEFVGKNVRHNYTSKAQKLQPDVSLQFVLQRKITLLNSAIHLTQILNGACGLLCSRLRQFVLSYDLWVDDYKFRDVVLCEGGEQDAH